jgi:gingipain R
MKQIKIIIAFLFITLKVFSQTPECLKISNKTNGIQIDFTLPEYQIIDTSLTVSFEINETYKYVKVNNNFGVINDIGYPEIPQISFDVAVPDDASNFQISVSDTEFSYNSINKRIFPSQDYFETETSPEFVVNEDYYNSNGELYNFNYQISESYSVFGQKGITITIFPFVYRPNQSKIEILQAGKFNLSYSSNKQAKNSNILNNIPTTNYLSKFFVNYEKTKTGAFRYGRYLIIAPPNFENTITYFANYKRNIGYDVVVVNTNETGTTAGDIKNYLQNQYDDVATRPTFVLLVGDIADIPASGGTQADYKDPLTDLNYSLLSGDDYFADVFLGRWSVTRNDELQNIIQKTIVMETQLHTYDRRSVFLAGSGSGENQFDNPMRWVMDNTFEPDGWECDFSFGVDGATQQDGINALNGDYVFILYRGHGGSNVIGDPFSLTNTHINASTNTVFSIFFSFACLTNNYGFTGPSFGESWIRSGQGGVAFFGASTTTYRHTNNKIAEKVFGDAFTDEEQLAVMKDLGMKRYWQRFWSWMNRKRTKRHMKTYNFLGDPSFNKPGIGCINNITFDNPEIFHNDDVITYHAGSTIENNNTFEVQSGSNVTLIAGESIVLNPGFHAEAGSNFQASIAPCDEAVNKKSENKNANKSSTIQADTLFNELIQKDASIFPNPFSEFVLLNYSLNNTGKVHIKIYDISGNLIFEKLQIKNKGIIYENINTSHFNPGTYIYNIQTEDIVYKGKIIKID